MLLTKIIIGYVLILAIVLAFFNGATKNQEEDD